MSESIPLFFCLTLCNLVNAYTLTEPTIMYSLCVLLCLWLEIRHSVYRTLQALYVRFVSLFKWELTSIPTDPP